MMYLYLALAAAGHYAKPPEWTGGQLGAQGTVVTVTGRSITIRNHKGVARRYPASALLKDGGVEWRNLSSGNGHKLSDVRAGDFVRLSYDRDSKGKTACESVSIFRRPGGRVPATWGEDRFWDVIANAEQDAEAVGAPVPDWRVVVPVGTPQRWKYREP